MLSAASTSRPRVRRSIFAGCYCLAGEAITSHKADIYRGITPFLIALFALLGLLMLVLDLALHLPHTMR